MKKRPNPFLHMLLWGTAGGYIIALGYIPFILIFSSSAELSFLDVFLNPLLWQLSIFFGAIPGALLGLLTGLNVWFVMRKVKDSLSAGKIIQQRPELYATTMALSAVVALNLIAAYFSMMSLFFIPLPFIAAIAATYAAHHYTERLLTWRSNIEIRKSKRTTQMPDVSRLQDKFSNGLKKDDMIEERKSLSGSAYE